MSDDVNKNGGIRGFGLQCPWSNCFPQLFQPLPRTPCTSTPFASFRELIDHIWKYHSFLLCCELCDHRFSSAKRGEKDRQALDSLKNGHIIEHHSNKDNHPPMSPYDSIKTMTEEQDKDLRNWKSQNTKDKDAAKYNYGSLCRALFGKGVRVPDNHVYHYLVAEYTINPDSRNLGEENLRYVRQRQFVAQPGSTASPSHQAHEDDHHHHHNQQQPTLNPHYQQQPTLNPHYQQHPNPIQHTINPLQLDDSPQPLNWAVPKTAPDQDSGYDSWASREPAPQRENSGAYMDMNSVWGTETVWPQPNEDVASTGTFFQDALYQPPWDLENSDAPPG